MPFGKRHARETEFAADGIIPAELLEMLAARLGVRYSARAQTPVIGLDIIDLPHDPPQGRFFAQAGGARLHR